MDRGFEERNRAGRDRMRAIAGRLSDEELTHPIDGPWTAAALLTHVAFWDRFVYVRWVQAARTGGRTPAALNDAMLDLINDAALRQWTLLSPREAAEECLAAAEEVDALIRSLEADAVSEVVGAGRERLVDRSIHRGEHVDTIEAAFPAG